jgi:sugar O-acyltransferase (sialic acid O-acetyltransferase NeuD family)
MINDLVILGVGFPDIIQIIGDINKDKKTYNIVGFIDDNPIFHNKVFYNYPVVGSMQWLESNKNTHVVNTVARNMSVRRATINKLKSITSNFPNIIHPSVNVKYLKLGHGNIISKNAYFEVSSSIGSHCMILPNVTIGHDTSISDNCFFGPNSSVLGGVNIHENCLVGSGAIILPKVKISKNVVIGINSSVYSDLEEGLSVMSMPAKVIYNNNN